MTASNRTDGVAHSRRASYFRLALTCVIALGIGWATGWHSRRGMSAKAEQISIAVDMDPALVKLGSDSVSLRVFLGQRRPVLLYIVGDADTSWAATSRSLAFTTCRDSVSFRVLRMGSAAVEQPPASAPCAGERPVSWIGYVPAAAVTGWTIKTVPALLELGAEDKILFVASGDLAAAKYRAAKWHPQSAVK